MAFQFDGLMSMAVCPRTEVRAAENGAEKMAHAKTKANGDAKPASKHQMPMICELASRRKREEREVDKLFRALVKLEGSDLHLKVGRPPMIRSRGFALTALNRGPIEARRDGELALPDAGRSEPQDLRRRGRS